ncbi:hypothetical protein GIW70_06185 [Pseudomonas syringae]|nr:hypothetical protein [Pseudomonas syringae]
MSKKNVAPGTLDPTFGNQGAVRLPFPGFPEFDVRSVLELPDKKLLVATVGWIQEPARIWRLNEDGTLDTQFGDGGALDIALKNAEMYFISAFSALSNGGWLIAGSYLATDNVTGLALVRFRADGQLDESFGEQGVRFLPYDEMGQPDKAGSQKRRRMMARNPVGSGHNVAQQVDGKIVFVTSVYME